MLIFDVFDFGSNHLLMNSAVDVERHARDFMEAAKKLQLYFMGLKREDHAPTRAESLKKVLDLLHLNIHRCDDTLNTFVFTYQFLFFNRRLQ